DKQESEVFNRAMTAISEMVIPAVLETYDFSGIETLVDVAGGHGQVLSGILQKYPKMRGVLSDLPHVLEGARPRLRDMGLESRCRFEPCDFFKNVPSGGDAYIMKHIIHDWDDEKAGLILRNIHAAFGAKKGKLILLEALIAADNLPHFGKFVDIEMLAMAGGRERTEAEFRALFERAGFRMTRIVPNKSPICAIEAEKV
ncbi:MAG: methyltransferase, partial [Acidobacteria bacterium]|nr:methyltransferase [Acidobacteriota bacterium]